MTLETDHQQILLQLPPPPLVVSCCYDTVARLHVYSLYCIASPAALLVALGDSLVYYSIIEESDLGPDFTSLMQNPLLNTATIIGY